MQPGQKKRAFLYAGIGFVAAGIASIVLTYMFIYEPLRNETAVQDTRFNLKEIHSVALARHDHVSLVLLVNGQQVVIPEGIGMNPQLWHDHSLDQYGPSGISPMHTHDTTGTIHIESTVAREYTLGEFLKVAGISTDNITRTTVDGNELVDIQNHAMKNGEKLRVEFSK
ncbi:MAG: hypothetical protein E6K85_10235 [Thaumarchaeota archaeon]|nr:MAG: hypothetical protein E6K85_10235 [Nitrososphaerota archaeon]